ncbi:hypothetical protein Tco_0567197 [Tanacetum coccineum]
MFVLTVSTAEPKNIKVEMVDSAWIEAMQEELHKFDRLQVWELVGKPFGKTIIKLKWLWKNKKDEDQTDSGFELIAFLDADHAGCLDTRKSTSGGIQFLEVEYMALSASCAQVMWMRTQLKDYGFNYNKILGNQKHRSDTLSIHGDEGNPLEPTFKQACGWSSQNQRWRWRYLILAGSDSLPHAHAQTTKTYFKHQIKNQESSRIKDKDFRKFDILKIPPQKLTSREIIR